MWRRNRFLKPTPLPSLYNGLYCVTIFLLSTTDCLFILPAEAPVHFLRTRKSSLVVDAGNVLSFLNAPIPPSSSLSLQVGSRGEKLQVPKDVDCIPEFREMIDKCFRDAPERRPGFNDLTKELEALCRRVEAYKKV